MLIDFVESNPSCIISMTFAEVKSPTRVYIKTSFPKKKANSPRTIVSKIKKHFPTGILKNLLKILTEPKNAPVRQYQELLAMYKVKLEFEHDALLAVAKKAIERKTGARSLRGILEDVMLDIMYEIPQSDEPRKVIITKDCIENHTQPKIEPISTNDTQTKSE